MLEAFKAAPITWSIAFVVVLLAGIGLIVAIVTKGRWEDRGLMKTKDGKPYKWERDNFPLAVWLHPGLPNAYFEAFKAARRFIIDHSGVEVFDLGTELPEAFQLNRLGEGQVVIAMSDQIDVDNPDKGNTSLTIMATGEIKNAVVTLPPARNAVAKPITLHELMHVLGFAHDEGTRSLLHPQLQARPQEITELDRKRLKSVADTTFKKGRAA